MTYCANCLEEEATEYWKGYPCCEACFTQAQLPPHRRGEPRGK